MLRFDQLRAETVDATLPPGCEFNTELSELPQLEHSYFGQSSQVSLAAAAAQSHRLSCRAECFPLRSLQAHDQHEKPDALELLFVSEKAHLCSLNVIGL